MSFEALLLGNLGPHSSFLAGCCLQHLHRFNASKVGPQMVPCTTGVFSASHLQPVATGPLSSPWTLGLTYKGVFATPVSSPWPPTPFLLI